MEIRITPNIDAKKVIERWRKAPRAIHNNVFLALLSGLKRISRESKTQYLSGPRPHKLDIRSGRLRGIQGYTVGPWKGRMLEGRVGYGIGIHATRQISYDWIHEKGFHGIEHVKAYDRIQTHLFGVPTPPYQVHVPAHFRRMNMPARPFLGPPVFKNYVPIGHQIAKSMLNAIRGA